jgi:Secretion system C-terminal sorting domain
MNGANVNFIDGASNSELTTAAVTQLSANDFVAASAFDVRTNKLFYATMHTGQLRWIDLSNQSGQLNVYIQQQQFVSSSDLTDESINVTRMCIGADGNGYALTNDGNHLYRFTTGNKPVVTDLGNLVDADNNNGLSIHNKCSSWGGDMVADAYGKLYVVTATHSVFVVDVNTRIATFLGGITGLPGTYTTNAATVDDNGNIVVASSAKSQGFYKVNLSSLVATKIPGSDTTYSISDLANANLLLQNESDALGGLTKVVPTSANSGSGHIFPNPTTGHVFNVSFDGLPNGEYLIDVTDLSGKAVFNKSVNVGIAGQVETVNVTSGLAVGMYLVKVSSADKQNSFTEKIVIN